MENTVHANNYLSDQQITAIAWDAVRKHFELVDYEGADIEIRYPAVRQLLDNEDAGQVYVWLNHIQAGYLVSADATMTANGEIWHEARTRGDPRFFSLFHGFPNDPARQKQAA
jgi:hypothetical protein